MALDKRKLILASGSPRRRELISWLKSDFEVCPSDVEEITKKTLPSEVVIELAMLKGDDIFEQRVKDEIRPLVVSSDTIVVIDNKILGKPKDREDAKSMLQNLSGRHHEVYTAIYLKSFNNDGSIASKSFYIKTDVKFSEIAPDLLEFYLDGDEPYDKAGAYGIQGQGLLFVESISGSYSNVVGFPLSDFFRELRAFILELGIKEKSWQNVFNGN